MSCAVEVRIPMPDGTEVVTSVFQLLQWKHAVALEDKGLKMSRGSVTAHVKKVFGLKRNTPRADIVECLTIMLNDVKEQMEADRVTH